MEPRVYQAADGRWLIFNNGIKSGYFTLESEARNMADKIKFSSQAQEFCTTLAQLFKDARDLHGVYFDEGFNDIGSDPIVDVDIESLPGSPTAADVTAFVTVAEQLQKFDIGDVADPVINANYGTSVNRMRTDV
jgi:hypothetical protein